MKFWHFCLAFWLGFISCVLFYSIGFSGNLEFPMSINFNSNTISPSDFLTEENIVINDDRVIIYVEGASLSRYAGSGSMRPLLDSEANGLRIVPKGVDDINVGDIISYRKDNKLIVHRVIMKSVDDEGIYFITAGDNNDYLDGKIRFANIEYKTIGILY